MTKPSKKPTYRAWVRRFETQIAPVPGVDTIVYECGTLDRKDGGDPYEHALFTSPSGRIYVVERST